MSTALLKSGYTIPVALPVPAVPLSIASNRVCQNGVALGKPVPAAPSHPLHQFRNGL